MDEWVQLYDDTCNLISRLLYTQAEAFIMTGSGSAATEGAVCSLLEPGDKIVAEDWVFNEPAHLYGGKVIDITPTVGEHLNPNNLERTLEREKNVKLVALLHNVTRTGVMHPIRELGKVVHDADALFIVDAISSIGGIELRMDDWNIDVVIGSGTKALGIPPGIATVTVSDAAWEKIQHRRTPIPSLYLNYWRYRCPTVDPTRKWCPTPTTPATTLIRALNQSLRKLHAESLDKVYERHRIASEAVRAAFQAGGFKLLVKDEHYASNTVTAVQWPQDYDYARFWQILYDEYDIMIGNVPPERKSWFRIAHFGQNTSPEVLLAALGKIEEALSRIGYPIQGGAMTDAASAAFQSLGCQ
jgi:aspartate aminotransferase-like enzyme